MNAMIQNGDQGVGEEMSQFIGNDKADQQTGSGRFFEPIRPTSDTRKDHQEAVQTHLNVLEIAPAATPLANTSGRIQWVRLSDEIEALALINAPKRK